MIKFVRTGISKKGSDYQDNSSVVNEDSERSAVDPREFLSGG